MNIPVLVFICCVVALVTIVFASMKGSVGHGIGLTVFLILALGATGLSAPSEALLVTTLPRHLSLPEGTAET